MVQDLYFEVLRKKSHYFLDAKETATIKDLKLMIQGILKLDPSSIELWKLEEEGKKSVLVDATTLADCGFSATNAKAQMPAQLGLQIRGEDEDVKFDDVSLPPPIPDALQGARGDNAPTD
ncbi:unnamed protein product [Caenorhabditis angaria]|uniref:Ubiquitin-like domain-containing protein n=1 Tax=Caenorhabditis angaria TaxID=860376 RepID=A0A9P1IIG6_9PELO|nr:unnamed protein product [Caenorhabditis angaria]